MNDEAARLSQADDCHDTEPERAAAVLLQIDAARLDAHSWPLLAFLLNHVLGEKLWRWADADAQMQGLLAAAGEAATPLLWRQAAVAAGLAGDRRRAREAAGALAKATGVGVLQAGELVQVASAAFQVGHADAMHAARIVFAALHGLEGPHWRSPSELDTAAAASCNNIAASLAERDPHDLRLPALRQALMQCAGASQRLWRRAGGWVQHERACYGVAVAAAACGEWHTARAAAREGLDLLDTHDAAGEENVDRAFLELELAHAERRLGQDEAAAAARGRADALAARFEEVSLREWYAQRLARQQPAS